MNLNILSYNHIIFRTTNLAADYVTLNMMIPETLVGGLIGRCGSNISRIRNESGAMIKVCKFIILMRGYLTKIFRFSTCLMNSGLIGLNEGRNLLAFAVLM